MKSMILHFEEDVYAKIPSPKSTWVRSLVFERLQTMGGEKLDVHETEFCFMIGGKFVRGVGENKKDALMRLGYKEAEIYAGLAQKHGTVDEAKAGGWWEDVKSE